MQREPVQSSQIRSVGYEPASRTLEIEFSNGAVYQYSNVDPDIHTRMMESSSVGSFFNQNVRGVHEYIRLET